MRTKKRTPTYLKLVSPRSNHRRANLSNEPQPTPELPEPPAELCEDAKAEWVRISRETPWLTVLDAGLLAGYCQAYGRWLTAERAIAEMARRDQLTDGLMIKTTSGNAIQNPLVGTANRAMVLMSRFAAELGMSPSALPRR